MTISQIAARMRDMGKMHAQITKEGWSRMSTNQWVAEREFLAREMVALADREIALRSDIAEIEAIRKLVPECAR